MPKDIRKMLENYREESQGLSANHTHKFEKRLMREMHASRPKNRLITWLSVAASVILLISLAIQFYPEKDNPVETPVIHPVKQLSLGEISPELKAIETYYVNNINLEISQIEITEENKEMLDGYLAKIGELTQEYKSLTEELNKNGINDVTIDALISNLQLRLQLLKRLKKQLMNLKKLNNKQDEIQQV